MDNNSGNSQATPAAGVSLKKVGIVTAILYAVLIIVFAVSFLTSDPRPKLDETHWPYILTVVNCFLLFLFLYLGLKGPIVKMLDDAVRKTEENLEAARNANLEAANLQQKSDSLTAELDKERQSLAASLEDEKKRAADRIMAQAKEEAAGIMAEVKQTFDSEMENAKRQIRNELLNKALESARQQISAQVSLADHERLLNSFIKDMEQPS